MLPNQARWIDSADASHLHWWYVCVAVVRADGSTSITGWGYEHACKAANRAQGKRWVEAWVARRGWPLGDRVRRAGERMGL